MPSDDQLERKRAASLSRRLGVTICGLILLGAAGTWIVWRQRSLGQISPNANPSGSSARGAELVRQLRAAAEARQGRKLEQFASQCLALQPAAAPPVPATLQAWAILLDHYLLQERWDEARAVVWKLHKGHQEIGRPTTFFLRQLLQIRYEKKAPAVAIPIVRELVAHDAADDDSRRALGIYQLRGGEIEAAKENLGAVFRRHSSEARFVDAWLDSLVAAGDFDLVDQVIEGLAGELKQRAEYWLVAGRGKQQRGDWDGARRCYQSALELQPKRIEALNLLTQAVRQTGDAARAAELTLEMRRLHQALRDLGEIYQRIRHTADDPEPELCRRIADLCSDLGADDEASEWRPQ